MPKVSPTVALALGYTDIQAQLPSRTILTFIALICALLFFANVWRRSWMLPGMGLGLLVLSAVLLGGVWPLIVQQFQVSPNEADKEADYIARNIEATRDAFDIADVQTTVYPATTQVTAGQLAEDADTVPGIRLIDPNIVPPTFEAQQQVRGFYSMADTLDVDRYTVDGMQRDMVVGVRELDVNGIPERNWINEHTVYTHGFGFVAAYGNQRATDGSPVYAERDIPPTGVLGDDEPRIYFGETSPEYSIVGAPEGADPVEFDIPEDVETTQERRNTYEGSSGVEIGGLFNKLLYAMKYQEGNILLSDRVNDESKILYHRTPRDRVQRVAPWLHVDRNAYPAVVDGRVLWLLDGYTTLDHYPYSQRIDLEEATADSRTIAPTSVAAAPARRSTTTATPSRPRSTPSTARSACMPGTRRPGARAGPRRSAARCCRAPRSPTSCSTTCASPRTCTRCSAGSSLEYHVTEPRQFYGGQTSGGPDRPTSSDREIPAPLYLSLRMPDTDGAGVLADLDLRATEPAEPRGIHGGQRRPAQRRLRQHPHPSTARHHADRRAGPGGQRVRVRPASRAGDVGVAGGRRGHREGNLLTLPVGGGLLYIQPIYVERTGTAATFPLLRLVIVSFGERIGVADTLQGALDQIFEGESGAETGEEVPPGTGGTPEQPTTRPTPAADVQAALDDAIQAFTEADAALRAGDLAAYAEAVERANQAVARANELLAGESASPSPSRSP